MTIFTVKFNVDDTSNWDKLLKVFLHSIRTNSPQTKIVVREIAKPNPVPGKGANLLYNTVKLDLWRDYMIKTRDNTIFIDCDMLCLSDPAPAFDQEFDVAITTGGEEAKPPLNAGVVFARPTWKAKEFFKQWAIINRQMFRDREFHGQWKSKYLGMNQAALGCMIETGLCDYVHRLPQARWNITDKLWGQIGNDAVFLHIKSELRNLALQNAAPYAQYKKALTLWQKYARQAGAIKPDEKIIGRAVTGKRRRRR